MSQNSAACAPPPPLAGRDLQYSHRPVNYTPGLELRTPERLNADVRVGGRVMPSPRNQWNGVKFFVKKKKKWHFHNVYEQSRDIPVSRFLQCIRGKW